MFTPQQKQEHTPFAVPGIDAEPCGRTPLAAWCTACTSNGDSAAAYRLVGWAT